MTVDDAGTAADEKRGDASTREAAIRTWLRGAPNPVAIALDRASVRVPLPAAECFRGVATLPGDAATFVDSVVPADRMTVVRLWESAQRTGMAEGTVRMPNDPGRAMRLRFVDASEFFGSWIGLLADQGAWDADPDADPLDPATLTPRRPRTGTLGKNLYAIITAVDSRFTQMLGWTAADLVGHRSLDFMHPDDHERAIAQWLEVRSSRATQRVRVRHRHRDGRWVWVEVENTFLRLDEPEGTVVTTLVTDISDEMAAHETVRQQRNLLRRVADSLPIGLMVLGEDRGVVFVNAGLAGVLGLDAEPSLDAVLRRVHAGDRARLEEAVAAAIDRKDDRSLEVGLATHDPRRCLVTLAALTDDEGLRGAVVSVTDVTASSRLRDDLTARATRDPLTGCRNRASIRAELDRVLDQPGPGRAAVLFLDLDRFKEINDTHGHQVGDELLVRVTRLLTAALRRGEVLGRWGGDEFLVVVDRVPDEPAALAVAERLADALAEPIGVAGAPMAVTCSVGVAIAGPDAATDALIAQADAAMYAAKQSDVRTAAYHSRV